MKRKLICIMAIAFTTWIIRAGVNPRIVKVNLDIDGMADGPAEFGTALEPGGPGGFVTKGGWKKIKLSVEGAGSARLNWNSDKIGVYMTQGGAALSTTREKIWTDVATMPAELWVYGVEASASGPAALPLPGETTLKICGPEHICLEALNNGTPYVTPYFDRVGFTVVEIDLQIHMPSVLDPDESRIPEGDKLSKGSVTFVNLDNDDLDDVFDSDPGETEVLILGGDNELVGVVLKIKPRDLSLGQVKLSAPEGASNIAIWLRSDMAIPGYTLDAPLNIQTDFTVIGDSRVKTMWVEGISAQTGTQRTVLKMEYTVDGVSCNDNVALTVLGIESVKWKAKANAYTADGKCNADTLDTHTVNGVLMERVFPCAATPGGNSKNNVEVVLKLSKATPYALNIPCRAFDVDDPSSDLAVDPNDAPAAGNYCDGYTYDATLPSPTYTVGEDNRGDPKSGTLAGEVNYSGCKIATIAVPADSDTGSIDFSVSLFAGDNYKVVANADKMFLKRLRNWDNSDGQKIVFKSEALPVPPYTPGMQQEIQLPGNYSTPNPLVVWRVLHVENDVMMPAGATNNRKSSVISEVTFDSGVPTSTIRFGDNIQGDMSSCLGAGGGQGKFENGLLQVPPFIPFYNRTILANGLYFAVLATRLEFNFQAKSTTFFGSLIQIVGHTRYIVKDGGRTRVFVDSLTLVCNPDPPNWNSFVGGTIRIGGKDYLITAAEPYSFFIEGFEQGCTLHDDDDDTRVSTRLDLTAAATAFADAYILVVDDGGGPPSSGTPSNSGVGVDFVANKGAQALEVDVIAQGVAQSAASEPPNYWIGYVSTAHQGGDRTADAEPNSEGADCGEVFANTSTFQGASGGNTAWVYVETIHDCFGVSGSQKVQIATAHELGHACGLADTINTVGGGLMEPLLEAAGPTFIGRDANLLRCRIVSPERYISNP
jgi:hypothetical protein